MSSLQDALAEVQRLKPTTGADCIPLQFFQNMCLAIECVVAENTELRNDITLLQGLVGGGDPTVTGTITNPPLGVQMPLADLSGYTECIINMTGSVDVCINNASNTVVTAEVTIFCDGALIHTLQISELIVTNSIGGLFCNTVNLNTIPTLNCSGALSAAVTLTSNDTNASIGDVEITANAYCTV